MIWGINWLTQLALPFIFGGAISFLRYTFQVRHWDWKEGVFKQFISGSIAGIVAVNMFNPKGSFDQVIVISVFAGTHGMAWILANSFMSSRSATDTIRELYEQDSEVIDTIMEAPLDGAEDLTNVENMLNRLVEESHEDVS